MEFWHSYKMKRKFNANEENKMQKQNMGMSIIHDNRGYTILFFFFGYPLEVIQ